MEKIISDHFEKEWYFPHVLGTLDRKYGSDVQKEVAHSITNVRY